LMPPRSGPQQFPVKFVGTMTLDRNVDDYFAETEQVAFCTSHIVPGIEHSNDPLLQGRNFSYFDTQISRIGINFADIPINKPIGCPVMNNQRDGQGSHKIHKGTVNYFPNRYNAPHPVPPSQGGADTYPTAVSGVKTRERGPKFSEHIKQAQLFYNSMTPIEKKHIQAAAQFELGKVQEESIQQIMIEAFNRVDHGLALAVAEELSLECPAALDNYHGKTSSFLSMVSGKKQVFSAATRKVGMFVSDGFDASAFLAVKTALTAAGAIPLAVGEKQKVKGSDGQLHKGDFTFETCRSTMFDAVIVFGGGAGYESKLKVGRVVHAVREAYMHQKAIGVHGQAVDWFLKSVLPEEIDATTVTSSTEAAPIVKGVVFSKDLPAVDFNEKFISTLAAHRVWDRDVSGVAA